MSTSDAQPRPPQVTLAGWMIIVGSVMVVASVFELLTGLRSLETREGVEAFLDKPPGDTLGWSVETVLGFLRIASMVTAGCATAAGVLGWHALRRNRGARVGLTVLAVPLFLSGVVTGGFISSLVAAASLLLWLQPAKDWFDGKKWTPPTRTSQRSRDQDARPSWPPPVGEVDVPPRDQDRAAGSGQGPRLVQGFGNLVAADPQARAASDGSGATTARRLTRRPAGVLQAALLTWIFAGFTLLSSVFSMIAVAVDPAALTEELERQQPDLAASGISEDLLLNTTLVMGGLVALWSLAAVITAVLVVRRVSWSGNALLVLAVGSALGCAIAATAMVAMAVPALASVVVIVVLRRPEIRSWLALSPR